MKGFIDFIKEQGVVGLAIGFVLGTAVSELVSSFVNDILNPIIGLAIVDVDSLSNYSLTVQDSVIKIGSFLANLVDFVVLTAVVYFVFKSLAGKVGRIQLRKLSKKK